MAITTYVIALGSNRALSGRHPPHLLIDDATQALNKGPCRLLARSPVISTRPVGPAQRRFANAAAVIETNLSPSDLLFHLKSLEKQFIRKAARRWGDRTLDLDIILWSGGRWASRTLSIPHKSYRLRDFVMVPVHTVAPYWRDPYTGLSMRHLLARLKKRMKIREAS